MPNFSVILVEPQTSGNIGAIARLMGNFAFERLYLVDPVSIDDEAKQRAMHAKDILQKAKIVEDYEYLMARFDMVIGTSGINTEKRKKFLRKAETPEELADSISDYEGEIALVFGREDKGLCNEELKKSDRLVRIPASKEYPILNLSHAVGIVLYEIFKNRGERIVKRQGNSSEESERERLIQTFSDVLKETRYPEHKYEKTEVMFRKILGRACLTKWEYHRLMGVFSQILKEIEG
ncbi:MAG: RNA methyltransferase [Candidatus Thermoplasmatota archaeon]|nr:RNA methyltransferase [Candidatus Thermoplasmatota archaeon]MBS3789703.1 RNA methyltransferase [Candidatus Thermoplasmatota archaeon]